MAIKPDSFIKLSSEETKQADKVEELIDKTYKEKYKGINKEYKMTKVEILGHYSNIILREIKKRYLQAGWFWLEFENEIRKFNKKKYEVTVVFFQKE